MPNIRFTVSCVTNLTDRELEDVVSVSNLAYLHADSPAVDMLTGGKLELLPDLFRCMTRSCLIDGDCYIATEMTTGKIVGTAFWFGPGKTLMATEEARQTSKFYDFFNQLDQPLKDWWLNVYDTSINDFLARHYAPETSTDSWWLNNIAILPSYQRNGIGSLLFKQVLKKATTSEAIGCCTDTEKNVRFYKSMDMNEVGMENMPHPVDGRDVKIWGFKRFGELKLNS